MTQSRLNLPILNNDSSMAAKLTDSSEPLTDDRVVAPELFVVGVAERGLDHGRPLDRLRPVAQLRVETRFRREEVAHGAFFDLRPGRKRRQSVARYPHPACPTPPHRSQPVLCHHGVCFVPYPALTAP